MQIKVGKVYKCGDTHVKIVSHLEELSRRSMYDYIGIQCNSCGRPENCQTGMFSEVGLYYTNNPNKLKHALLNIITEVVTSKLQRIEAIEKELQQLKEEIKNAE